MFQKVTDCIRKFYKYRLFKLTPPEKLTLNKMIFK